MGVSRLAPNVIIPVAMLVSVIAGAVGYGQLQGQVNANRLAIVEIKASQDKRNDDTAAWREKVTKSLARIEQRLKLEPAND